MADAVRALLTTDPWGLFFEIIESTFLELTMELCSTFNLQVAMTNFDDPGIVQFRLGGLVHLCPRHGLTQCLRQMSSFLRNI
ncbi:hypothetical protein GOBAR_AA15642 [Gossypium barbadense]|uniref:Uncharacterized protein n=1 Tax=Gossypium barbadense TaxID=3634 RepID=A0A2P5XP25_GOSBA|nr:hypothetical protein GOBAR_AA15642 [Gossypium barbadense]